jgi:hypothetical protein
MKLLYILGAALAVTALLRNLPDIKRLKKMRDM